MKKLTPMGIVLPMQTVMNFFLLFSMEEVDQLAYAFAVHLSYQIFFLLLVFFSLDSHFSKYFL